MNSHIMVLQTVYILEAYEARPSNRITLVFAHKRCAKVVPFPRAIALLTRIRVPLITRIAVNGGILYLLK